MIVFVMVMLFSFNVCASDNSVDDYSGGHSVGRPRTPLRVPDHMNPESFVLDMGSDDSLCDAIVQSTNMAQSKHVHSIRPFLVEVIKESKSSPTANHLHRVRSLQRLKSGSISQSPDNDDSVGIHEMVLEAVQKVMDKQQQEIEGRWSKEAVAATSTISSVVVGVIVGLSQYFGSK